MVLQASGHFLHHGGALYILFMELTHLIDDGAITGMYIVIVVVNCTVIICSKLNRILEKLDKILKQSKDETEIP